MKDLLEAIEKLRKSKVRDLIDSRMRQFREKGEETSNEIFKELCFCILCANYSAERSIVIQEEIGEGFLTLKKSKLARRLRQLGYRYPETRAKYIVGAREYKKSLKKIIESFNSDTELREWLATNITGIWYKEASLPSHEKILAIIDGKVEPIEIGGLYRQYISGNFRNRKLETFSFNPQTLKFEIAPITKIMTHQYKKDMFDIQLEWGRRISVTGDHSLFTIGAGGIIPAEVRALKAGDFVAVPRSLPVLDSVGSELNLVHEFIRRNILSNVYLKSREYCNFLRKNYKDKLSRKNQYTQHFRGIVPLKIVARLPETAYDNDILKKFRVKISYRSSPSTINSVIELDKDLFWVLGLLIAEAAVSRDPIEITLGIEEHERFVRLNELLSSVFGLVANEYYPKSRNVYISKINNLLFFYFIRDVLGIRGFSDTKRIPRIVFSTSFANIVSFLQGYWEGDGWKKSESYFSVQTRSNDLAEDLLLILLMVGVSARACKKKSSGSKPGITNSIDFSGIVQPIQLLNKLPTNRREVIPNTGEMTHEILRKLGIRTRIGGGHTNLYRRVMRWKHIGHPSRIKLKEFLTGVQNHGTCQEIEQLRMIVDSDLSFARIKRTRRVPYRDKYVYDLEVAEKGKDFQNFVGGVGGLCLHNSHFMRNIGHTDVSIIDFHILDILERCGLIAKPKTLTKRRYLEIENILRDVARSAGLSLGELDLYLWYLETGKILK